jgi:hypothetical protein
MRGPFGPVERPHRHRLLKPLDSARRQRLPAPGPVPLHVPQGKPRFSAKSKVQRTDIQQPAHHPGSRFRGKQ